jgi:hypothetical protein
MRAEQRIARLFLRMEYLLNLDNCDNNQDPTWLGEEDSNLH